MAEGDERKSEQYRSDDGGDENLQELGTTIHHYMYTCEKQETPNESWHQTVCRGKSFCRQILFRLYYETHWHSRGREQTPA